jgi:predicted transcriptional regulator
LVINKKGTFIDGLQYSDLAIKDFNFDYRSNIKFKMAVEDTATHIGGLCIFGKSFGNYRQDLSVRINYSPL